MFKKLNTSFNQTTIKNYYNDRDVIDSVKKVTDAQGIVDKKTGFNIAFGVFNDDLTIMPNLEQFFKLRVRNFAFTAP